MTGSADSLRDRARVGIHAWITRSGRLVLALTPPAIVTAMTAAALAPVLLAPMAGGPTYLGQVLAALGGLGGNFLADVVHDVAARMKDEAAVTGVSEETMQAMLTRRLDRELAGPDAAGLRAEMTQLLLAINGVDETLRAAISSGVPGLAAHISREVAYLSATVSEYRELADSMLGALAAIQHDSTFIRAAVADQGDELRRMNMNMILLRRDILRSRPPAAEPAGESAGESSGSRPRVRPYPGLAAFGETDADWFYGRERLTALLVDQVRGRLHGGSPLMLVGTSGAGKSSVLRAGLIPELDTGGLAEPGSELWDRIVMTPGPLPFRDLALRLAQRAELAATTVLDELAADPSRAPLIIAQGLLSRDARRRRGVVTATPDLAALGQGRGDDPGPASGQGRGGDPGQAGHAGRARQRLILIIDQFEEIFTQCADGAERKRFVDAICAAARGSRHDPPPAVVIIGMRMSFTEQCTAHPELEPALRDPLIVGPMNVTELRDAIERPARRAGLSVQPGLAAAMLRDLGAVESPGQPDIASYDPGRLPLLAHALLETWQRSQGELSTAAYEAAGGITNALASKADAVYTSLDPARQQVARRLLERMVAVHADAQDSRRRMRRTALISELPAADAVAAGAILDRLEAERLVTADDDAVQFAHEALLRYWPRLAGWLRENRAWRREQQRLTDHAREWDGSGRHPDQLLRGAQLAALHEQLSDARRDQLGTLETAYLNASRDRRAVADRNRRALVAVLTVLVVLAGSLAAVAEASSHQARRQQAIARQQQAIAESVGLAAEATAALPGNPRAALLLSLEAYQISHTAPAVDGLLSAQDSFVSARLRSPAGQVNAVAYDPAAPMLASAGQGGAVTLWDTRTHRQLPPLRGTSAFDAVAFDPSGLLLAGAERDGTTLVWNMRTRALAGRLRTGPQPAEAVAFSADGILATAGQDGPVTLWRTPALTPVRTPAPLTISIGTINGIAFSPNGRLLAAACSDGTIRVWDTGRAGPPLILKGHGQGQPVRSVAFSPNGRLLASGDDSGAVTLWDLGTRRPSDLPLSSSTPVLSVAFSPDGKQLASAGNDEVVRLWDVSTRTQVGALTGPASAVLAVAFSPDGSALASADADGSVGLWNIAGPGQAGPAAAVTSPAGTVATAGSTNAVGLWSSGSRARYQLLAGAASPAPPAPGQNAGEVAIALALSPDGRLLASITNQGQVALDGTAAPYSRTLLTPRAAAVQSLAFRPGPGAALVLAAGGVDGHVYLTRLSDVPPFGTALSEVPVGEQTTAVDAVAFSPDGGLLAAGSVDGTIELDRVRVAQGVPKADAAGNPILTAGSVSAVAFSPAGPILAGASGTQVRLWNVRNPARPQLLGGELAGQSGNVISVAFSGDGRTLATATQDGTIRLWDVARPARPALLATLAGRGSPTSVAFLPGRRDVLVGAAADGTAVFWDTRPAVVAREICATRPAAGAADQLAPFLGRVTYQPVC